MKLQDAKLCLNCEEIYVGPVCPKCATPHCVFVTNWIQSLEKQRQRQNAAEYYLWQRGGASCSQKVPRGTGGRIA